MIKGSLFKESIPFLYDIDFIVIMTAYLLRYFGQASAGLFAFFQGLMVDVYSAGILGIFTFLNLAAFFCIQLGGKFFDLYSTRGLLILIAGSIIIKDILFIGLATAFSVNIDISSSAIAPSVLSGLVSALIAPFIYFIFNRYNPDLDENDSKLRDERRGTLNG